MDCYQLCLYCLLRPDFGGTYHSNNAKSVRPKSEGKLIHTQIHLGFVQGMFSFVSGILPGIISQSIQLPHDN